MTEGSRHENVKYGGGPHNLGDPNDKTLRVVEKEVMIPKLMRELAKTEKCATEVDAFTRCCQKEKVLMVVNCREENDKLKKCLISWYENEEFKEYCKKTYLKQRSEYRATGISKKKRQATNPTDSENV